MNRLIACAVLGIGLASSVVGCGDDDDDTPGNEAGSSAGGTSSAGKNAGGSSAQGGSSTTAGKSGGGAGNAGSGGKPGGGSAGTGGDAGASLGGDNLGGEANIGGESSGGAGGEGGAPTEPAQVANPYWLNKFCDSHASETVDCSNAVPWSQCYGLFYPYLSVDGGGGICSNETDMEAFPLTVGLMDALDDLAANCPDTTEADWSCDLQGTPQPKDQACKEANDAARAAALACEG